MDNPLPHRERGTHLPAEAYEGRHRQEDFAAFTVPMDVLIRVKKAIESL